MPDKISNKEYIDLLVKKYGSSERDSMTDEELLALLISNTDCKHHVRETVDAIKRHFGSCRRCYYASYTELTSIDGLSHNAAMLILLTSGILNHRDIPSLIGKQVKDYCELFLAVMRRGFDEELWAAALTEDGVLKNIERISSGIPGAVELRAASLCKFAADNSSRHLVIAHSHSEGSSTEASNTDIRMSEYIAETLALYGVELIGHVIVAGKKAEFFTIDR